MATLHPARCHGLADLGAIAPGFRADLVAARGPRVVPRADGDRRRHGRGARRGGAAVRRARGARLGARQHPARAARRRRARPRPGGGARARDRDAGRAADHRGGRGGAAAVARRPRRRRPRARPRQARRRRAPPRDRPGRRRAGARLRPARAARSPRPSRTTRTTSSSSASTTRACAPASSGSRELGGGIAVADAGAVRGELALPVAGSAVRGAGRGGRRRDWTSWSRCCASRA